MHTQYIPSLSCSLQRLQLELEEAKPLLEFLNQSGPELRTMSPGEGALKLEDIMHRDNKKYDTLSDQVQRRADRIKLQKQKSMEVSGE